MNALILATLMLISTPDETRLADIRKEVAARNDRAREVTAYINAVHVEIAKATPKPKAKPKPKAVKRPKPTAQDREIARLKKSIDRNARHVRESRQRERNRIIKSNQRKYRNNQKRYFRNIQRFGRRTRGMRIRSSVRQK